MRNIEALRAILERDCIPITECGCWIWIRPLTRNGYGRFQYTQAHRKSWELYRGPIPEGVYVLHHCDIRSCVNPDHLYLGTQYDNMRDMHTRSRKKNFTSNIGQRNPRARLSETDVREIRALSVSSAELARRYGISKRHINSIRARENWAHIP